MDSSKVKTVTLRAIKESTSDFEALEERLKEYFKKKIYYPILGELGSTQKTISNAADHDFKALSDALFSGRVTFSRGTFSGKLNASISKDLRSLGARWDRRQQTYKLSLSEMPVQIRAAIATSETRFREKVAGIDRKLAQILPEEIADQFKCADLFDSTLWKTDKEFRATVKGITVAPELTRERRKKIADEWQNDMQLWIRDFTAKQIVELRKEMQKSVFSGDRYGSAIKTIQRSYGVSERKAKFLARQETSLLMTKFKETRYADTGIYEYRWDAVAGSKEHPVRPQHKRLADASKAGKIFRWDDPPITTEPGEPERRNNPGEDYNCRCSARPVVRFKKDDSQKL